jgi:hypothetical protein
MGNELSELKARIAKLQQEIRDEKTQEYFFKLSKYWLDDIERGVCPPSAVPYVLRLVQQKLASAQ